MFSTIMNLQAQSAAIEQELARRASKVKWDFYKPENKTAIQSPNCCPEYDDNEEAAFQSLPDLCPEETQKVENALLRKSRFRKNWEYDNKPERNPLTKRREKEARAKKTLNRRPRQAAARRWVMNTLEPTTQEIINEEIEREYEEWCNHQEAINKQMEEEAFQEMEERAREEEKERAERWMTPSKGEKVFWGVDSDSDYYSDNDWWYDW